MAFPQAPPNIRRRFATAVLLVGTALVAVQIWADIPRETRLEVDLGELHNRVVEARLAYLQNGIELRGAEFRFPRGAPAILKHQLDLSPGSYEVDIELRLSDGRTETLKRKLQTPADGVVRIQILKNGE